MNREQIIEKVYRGLESQGFKRSVIHINGRDICQYRGRHGLKCAVGHLIPDGKYDERWEGILIHSKDLNGEYPILKACGVGKQHLGLLVELQRIHDYSPDPDVMKSRLDAVKQNKEVYL